MTPARKRIGRNNALASRETIYETADGLETESVEHYDITRKRVLYEDVQLVTYHRELGFWFVLLNVLVSAFFLALAITIVAVTRKNMILAVIWLAMAAPSLIALTIRLLLRVDVVTIFGRRSKATLRFSFRKKRAREIYGQICARVRQVQRGLEREVAEEKAAEFPQPPPLSAV